MKKIVAWGVLLCALFAGPAAARATVPVIDYENVAVSTGTGTTPGADDIRQIIIAAANSPASGGWTVARTGDGAIVASLAVRGKHSVSALITVAPGSFSVRYADSLNMKFSQEGGIRYIHPSYNKWVSNLMQTIRAEFARR
jgi:hypothetical protein